jgi:hypothetical protein
MSKLNLSWSQISLWVFDSTKTVKTDVLIVNTDVHRTFKKSKWLQINQVFPKTSICNRPKSWFYLDDVE